MNGPLFSDRADAGQRLAKALAAYKGSRPIVLAIPRGGVPIGRIVADALGAELDLVLVRKIGAPGHPEFAIGAVDEHGHVLLNAIADELNVDGGYVAREAQRQVAVLRARRERYRPGAAAPLLTGRTVIVVDDGLATGATMLAALRAVRSQRPLRLVCAVPVGARETVADVALHADDVVCLATPVPFRAVGMHYADFGQLDDSDVAAAFEGTRATADAATSRSVTIRAGLRTLPGDLQSPAVPHGLVIFAHGSGSSRLSPRNQAVARALVERGFATLLFDLLTPVEDTDRAARFDVGMLAERLDAAVSWARREWPHRGLPIGLFGASTGAAAALLVAARRPGDISAVVSRGGRPDLVGMRVLAQIMAPTLLIVGGADPHVLEANRAACAAMGNQAELAVVPGATHLFEEAGALQEVMRLAGDWFAFCLTRDEAGERVG